VLPAINPKFQFSTAAGAGETSRSNQSAAPHFIGQIFREPPKNLLKTLWTGCGKQQPPAVQNSLVRLWTNLSAGSARHAAKPGHNHWKTRA
jgi:hypothetical protein